MSTVACDINTLIKNAKCFNCFSQKENQAAIVYFLEQRRAALAVQTPQTPAQLRKAVQCFCTPADDISDAYDVAVAQVGAIVQGQANQTVAQIRSAINPFVNMSLKELRLMEILARCALNAYP